MIPVYRARYDRVTSVLHQLPVFSLYGDTDAGKTLLQKIVLHQYGAWDGKTSELLLADKTSDAVFRFLFQNCSGMVICADDPGLSAEAGSPSLSLQVIHEFANGQTAKRISRAHQPSHAGLFTSTNRHVLEGIDDSTLKKTLSRMFVMPRMATAKAELDKELEFFTWALTECRVLGWICHVGMYFGAENKDYVACLRALDVHADMEGRYRKVFSFSAFRTANALS